MLQALDAFENPSDTIDTDASIVENTEQSEDDKKDNIVTQLRLQAVEIQRPRDALYLAVHALLMEAGIDGIILHSIPTITVHVIMNILCFTM